MIENAELGEVVTENGRVRGVRIRAGGELPADAVVIAGGAWCAELGRRLGCPLPLRAVLRHLALLEPDQALDADFPVVWCLDPEVYFRPELARVLV